MKRIAFARCIGLIAGCVFAYLSVSNYLNCISMKADYDRWETARAFAGSIDLSQQGSFKFEMEHTCLAAHDESFCLEFGTPWEEEEIPELLDRLNFEINFRDHSGSVINSADYGEKTAEVWQDRIVLGRNRDRFLKGDYQVEVIVHQPAKNLAGCDQNIYMKYELCGCETLPAMLVGVFAIFCSVMTLTTWSFSLPDAIRDGIWLKQSK